MKRLATAMALILGASHSFASVIDEDCYLIDMGGYYNLSLACHGSHQGAGRAAAISNPGDGDDDGGSDDDGSDDGDHDCGDGHDGGYDDDKDNNGHGNGDEGDCKGRGCHDDDNPGKGPKH